MIEDVETTTEILEEDWMDGGSDDYLDIPPRTRGMKRIIDAFCRPRQLAQNIKYHKNFGSALMFLILMSLLSLPFTGKITKLATEAQNKSVREFYGDDFYTFYQQQVALASPAGEGGNAAISVISALASFILSLVLAFIPAFFFFIGSKLFKSTLEFSQIYAYLIHIACITALGSFLTNIASFWLETIGNIFSLGNFIDIDVFNPMYYVLSAISIFSIWHLIYSAIGISELGNISKAKGFMLSLIFFAITIALAAVTPSLLKLSYNQLNSMLQMGG